MGKPLAIVTSQWPIVPTGINGRMMLGRRTVSHALYHSNSCFAKANIEGW